jgi:hypothetical protein
MFAPLCPVVGPVAAVVDVAAPVWGVLRLLLLVSRLGLGLGLVLPPGVVGVDPEAPFAPAQVSSTGEASRPGISLLLRRTELKNFSAVFRSLKVISVEVDVVWMSVNSPMPWGCLVSC